MGRFDFPRVFSFEPVARILSDAPNLYGRFQSAKFEAHRGAQWGDVHSAPATDRTMGEILGVSARQIQRWRREGMTERHADHVAAALNHHPAELWGELWWWTSQLEYKRPKVDGRVCAA